MKKILLLLLIIPLYACSSNIDPNKENTSETVKEDEKTCIFNTSDMSFTNTYIIKNKSISQVKVTVVVPSSLLGSSDFANLSDDKKEALQDSVLNSLGIRNVQGVNVSSSFDSDIKIDITIDLSTTDEDTLKTLQFDKLKNSNIDDVIKNNTDNGAICE